jgi:hypothetical protein
LTSSRRRSPSISLATPAISDSLVFARAQEDGRAIVTDNVADFEVERLDREERGQPHRGVIYALDPPFNRHRSDLLIGQMVCALEHFLRSQPPTDKPFNRVHWLRPAPE